MERFLIGFLFGAFIMLYCCVAEDFRDRVKPIKFTSAEGEKCELRIHKNITYTIVAPHSFMTPKTRMYGMDFKFIKSENESSLVSYTVMTPNVFGLYTKIGYITKDYNSKKMVFLENNFSFIRFGEETVSDNMKSLVCNAFIRSVPCNESAMSIYDIDSYLYGLKVETELGDKIQELSGFITKSYYMYQVWLNNNYDETKLSNDDIVSLAIRLENLYLNGSQGLCIESLAFILVNNQEWTDDEIYDNYSDNLDFGY